MILFSGRIRLAAMYELWRRKNFVADCPMSVVTFLQTSGLLDEEACKEALK